MPFLDGTGPGRMGSTTGRGFGYCTGYSRTGFINRGFVNPAPAQRLSNSGWVGRGRQWSRGRGRRLSTPYKFW